MKKAKKKKKKGKIQKTLKRAQLIYGNKNDDLK